MDKTSELALQSKNNPYVRNSFIHENREFILQFSSFVCKRQLDWTNDDELSVAIIAFNEAIDSYNISLGKDFINYAKIVIKNRLIDYFRKESKHRYVPIDVDVDEEVYRVSLEEKESIERYQIEVEKDKMAFEVMNFGKILSEYGITLEDLAANSPVHKKTRLQMMNLAFKISQHPEMVEKIKRTKQLPIKDICSILKSKKRQVGRWRKYIIALVIVLTHKELYGFRTYIFSERGKE